MRYVEHTDAVSLRASLIECYKAVFAAPPWNEDWWTDALVEAVIDRYAGSNAKILLAVENGRVIGFAWGACWQCSELCQELELTLPYPARQRVGYIKDIGVLESHRNQGIARGLLRALHAVIGTACDSQSYLLARTLALPEPSLVYQWFPRLGFGTIARYPEASDRRGQVILGAPIADVSF